jgi:translation initiation factor RLI1
MTQVVLNIKDSKLGFFFELIKNFDFVNVEKDQFIEPTKKEIKESIRQGLKEVSLIEQGEIEATEFNDFLNEL